VPIARWWTPDELTALAAAGRSLGIAHVEATPLTRSSHHAEHSYEVATAATPVALSSRR
jgi:lipoic acid synthetase